MTDSGELTKYFGFTENEVKELCCKYEMKFDSLREWYNGYLIDCLHIYNPNSVSQSMRKHKIKSYWKDTSAFDTINQFINLNFDGLKEDVITMLSGGRVDVNTKTFKNDLSVIGTKNEVLTPLIHLGYDAERNKAYIPNYEVATAFQSALETGKWTDISSF